MANLHFSFLIALVFLYSSVAQIQDPYIFNRQITLPSPAFGPDSIAFTQNNPEIAYVSVSDGRVLKLDVKDGTFQEFAYTSPERNKQQDCDGNMDPNLAETCGNVLGLSVDNKRQILYAVDAYHGLFSIQIPDQVGLATSITHTAGGQPLTLSSGVDVDPTTGDVYFVDASLTLDYRSITNLEASEDRTGRLIKYNRETGEVTVLLIGLNAPSGPAVSYDGTFVLIPLVAAGNSVIKKYYIKGPEAGTTHTLLSLKGSIGQIKRASTPGEFWVAYNRLAAGESSITTPTAYKFDSFGIVLVTQDLSPQYNDIRITNIQETHLGETLFVGSGLTNYIAEYYSIL